MKDIIKALIEKRKIKKIVYVDNEFEIDVYKNNIKLFCKHSKKCTFYTLRFGCSFAAVNTIKPQLL